jgi:hypothetical protein
MKKPRSPEGGRRQNSSYQLFYKGNQEQRFSEQPSDASNGGGDCNNGQYQ